MSRKRKPREFSLVVWIMDGHLHEAKVCRTEGGRTACANSMREYADMYEKHGHSCLVGTVSTSAILYSISPHNSRPKRQPEEERNRKKMEKRALAEMRRDFLN